MMITYKAGTWVNLSLEAVMSTTLQTTDAAASAVLEAVLNRRSPAAFSREQPARAQIEQLIQAAVRAPNHYRNEPWRFFVLTGPAREQLGEVFAESLKAKLASPDAPENAAALERERAKPLRAPVVIAVAAVKTDNPKALPDEDLSATAAAVENLLTVAPALGLGAFWRTGDAASDERVKAFFGLRPEDRIVAFVYVGYPEVMGKLTPRRDVSETTTWLGWNE
jgi:nitroreductase